MREIKFRAWNKNVKAYLKFPVLISSDGQVVNIDHLIYGDSVIIEQFTGLLDKNGKEIYEGDIIQRTGEVYAKDDVRHYVWKNMPAVVIYDNNAAKFIPHGNRVYYLTMNCDLDGQPKAGEWEVIGNIHENSELLK